MSMGGWPDLENYKDACIQTKLWYQELGEIQHKQATIELQLYWEQRGVTIIPRLFAEDLVEQKLDEKPAAEETH